MKTNKLLQEIKGVFIPPKKKFYFGKVIHGTPYFLPKNWINIKFNELGWKDKWNSPRMEWTPRFNIKLFGLQFCIFWVSPDEQDDDLYYEMILWWLFYCKKDIELARNTWGWVDCNTKETTWNDKYLI